MNPRNWIPHTSLYQARCYNKESSNNPKEERVPWEALQTYFVFSILKTSFALFFLLFLGFALTRYITLRESLSISEIQWLHLEIWIVSLNEGLWKSIGVMHVKSPSPRRTRWSTMAKFCFRNGGDADKSLRKGAQRARLWAWHILPTPSCWWWWHLCQQWPHLDKRSWEQLSWGSLNVRA